MKNLALFLLSMALLPFTAHATQPPTVEVTVYSTRLQTLVLPGIAGSSYYFTDAQDDNGVNYVLILPSDCPVKAGEKITIVADEVRYVLYRGAKYYDYMGAYKMKVKQ
jgi:hypothetical protein